MSMPLSHFVPAHTSPSPYPQVHSLPLRLYSCPAPRFVRTFFFFFRFHIYVLAYSIYFSLFLKNLFIYLFIYLFLAVLGLRFCARALSRCGERGPLFIAVRGPLTIVASLAAEHRLQTRRLSSCGSWAQLLCGMWDPPRPGLEPVSSALAGRFSTTAPPGKPYFSLFDLLPFVWQSLGPSTSLQITQFSFFLWLSNIPLCICATSSLSILCRWTLRLLPCPGYCK